VTLGALAALAASPPASSNVQAGVLGFLVVAGIGVALVFLLRSMNKQFRKITPVPGPDSGGGTGPADGTGPDGGTGSDGEQAGQESKAPAQTPE
jgi:hypothetical protein